MSLVYIINIIIIIIINWNMSGADLVYNNGGY